MHPYLRWRPWDKGSVWAALGVGSGRVENRRDHLGRVESGDLSMFTAWGSGRHDLTPAGGGADLALLGDLAFLRMRADAAQGALAGLSSSVGRLRLGLEGSYEVRMDTGTLSPFGQVSARHDSGDGETGSGVEVSGGVRYQSGRMSFETGARALWTGRAGSTRSAGGTSRSRSSRARTGGGCRCRWRPPGARRSIARWRRCGAPTRSRAWTAGRRREPATATGCGRPSPTACAGPASASKAMLTPYAEHERFSSGGRRTSLGVRLELPRSSVEVDLRGELGGSGQDAGGPGLFLDLKLRF